MTRKNHKRRRAAPRQVEPDAASNASYSSETRDASSKRRVKYGSFFRPVWLVLFFLPLASVGICRSVFVAATTFVSKRDRKSELSSGPNETNGERLRKKKESKKDRLGHMGEEYFISFIENMPECEPVASNLENFYCEMDVVYLDRARSELVFVEIKTRRRESTYHPTINAVNSRRQKKMALAARDFAEKNGYGDLKRRFDVAVIIWKEEEAQPYVSWYQNVFTERLAVRNYLPMDFGKNRKRTKENA